MKEEVIFRMESAYREDFEVKSYHFGGPERPCALSAICAAMKFSSSILPAKWFEH